MFILSYLSWPRCINCMVTICRLFVLVRVTVKNMKMSSVANTDMVWGVLLSMYTKFICKYFLVFMSPEAATTRPWRAIFGEAYFKTNLSLLAIDEAHCITEWSVSEVRYEIRFLMLI